MKTKKNLKSNLEKKSNLFFEIGITLVLAILLVAFESGESEAKPEMYAEVTNANIDVDIIPITRSKTVMPKPPTIPIEFNIIEDAKLNIDETDLMFNSESNFLDDMPLVPFEEEPEVSEPSFFVIVEDMPKYHNGNESLFQQDVQRIVKYPEAAIELGIQGMVSVAFTIDKKGKLVDPQVLRSPDILLSNAVLEALSKTDMWTPGEQRKRKVPVRFTIPIFFKLR